VLIDGDLVLYEAAAICLHLADTHPEQRLAPELGTPERAQFYKYMAPSCTLPIALLLFTGRDCFGQQ